MAVKLRLARRGRKKKPFYHIVVADARAPRDGRFIEKIGTYNPLTVPATITLDRDKAFDWLQQGAQPTDTVRSILRFKGVLYRKHLMRGVAKGAMTEEQAMKLYEEFKEAKESKVEARFEQSAKSKEEYLKRLGGEKKAIEIVVEETPVEEVTETVDVVAEAEPVVEAATETVEAVAEVVAEAKEEVTEVVEEVKEVVAEATPEAPAEEAKEEKNDEKEA